MNSSVFPFTFFLLYICLGMLTAYLATKKNRNPIGWFLAGMFFGIFAVIFLLILPPLSSSTQDDDSTERKDSEDFFLQNTLEDSEIISIPDTINQAAIDTEKWFYLSKDRTNVGPLSIVQLAAFLEECKNSPEKGIDPKELWVWKKGMANWGKVKDIQELLEMVKDE